MPSRFDDQAEWIETDGSGGFASGTVSGIRTRRYHAILLAATTPPTGRFVLVNGFDAWVTTPGGSYALSSQYYGGDVTHPDGHRRIVEFEPEPWPRWKFELEDGTSVAQEIVACGTTAIVSWKLEGGAGAASLAVRPFMSGRDFHSLHHENPGFHFEPDGIGEQLVWQAYPDVPRVFTIFNGGYKHSPTWFRNFLYQEERARGLDGGEDLASPGELHWDLSKGEAVWMLSAAESDFDATMRREQSGVYAKKLKDAERQRRRTFPSRLHRAAEAYVVRRGSSKTIVAGYPWFADWGRDTFISVRGLCIATGNLDSAREILHDWAGMVSEGMMPNRFPDRGENPEFNSVDASLWYVVAVYDFLTRAGISGRKVSAQDRKEFGDAIEAILAGYSSGTRFHIHADSDGLIAAGQPGVQLTWMDAKVGDWVVTPRVGKPVEIQALWLNALKIAGAFSDRWESMFAKASNSFVTRFWNDAGGYLNDVVDVDHEAGKIDARFRPNQIFAIGGLPFSLLEGERARRVVDAVESRLLTPLGLRSLAPGEPGYAGRYEGGVRERDGAYHQGTAWPWLTGPFVEAWVRVRGSTADAKREARERFLEPLMKHMDQAGIGHISEIADGDAPNTPRGCPFQAWSVGEAARLNFQVLAEEKSAAPRLARP
jgi:predicted glycogen debranching enzyme